MDTLFAQIPSWIILPAIILAALGGPTIWRMSRPIPPDDFVAIGRFTANRDQRVVEIRKLWFGPWRMQGGTPEQAGRPYRLCAEAPDGSRYVYAVTADKRDVYGNVELKQRRDGVWIPVLQ